MRNSPYSIDQKATSYKPMGSYGYVRECDMEKYWRDCKMIQLWEGGGQPGRFNECRGHYDCNL